MANHITNLTNRVAELTSEAEAREAEEKARQDRANEFRVHLQSAKFQGHEEDGTLRCTIQTADVHRWLDYIQNGN